MPYRLHFNMTLEEFKFTYCTHNERAVLCSLMLPIADMEWGHRFWGRVIGLVYGLPFMYFLSKVLPHAAHALAHTR